MTDTYQLSTTTSNRNYGPADHQNGFRMTLDYTFEKRSSPNGYVQALQAGGSQGGNKLSFVGNSGIKFGANNSREASILDMKAMVAQGGGMGAIKAAAPGSISGKVNVSGYLQEEPMRLMTGVIYNALLDERVKQFPMAGGTVKERIGTMLESNTNALGNTQLVLETTKNVDETWKLSIRINGDLTYEDPNFDVSTITTLSLQSHWGSGVIFNKMKVERK